MSGESSNAKTEESTRNLEVLSQSLQQLPLTAIQDESASQQLNDDHHSLHNFTISPDKKQVFIKQQQFAEESDANSSIYGYLNQLENFPNLESNDESMMSQ